MRETVMLEEIKKQPELMPKCVVENAKRLKDIAKEIDDFKPNNILIVARGTSLHGGMMAKYLFQLYYHIPVSLAMPSIFTIYDGKVDLSKTLVLAISQSGAGKDICTVVKKANASGALTVGITNTPDSIVARECKLNLYNEVSKAVSYAATKTYTSTIYLIYELLYNLTGNENLHIDSDKLVASLQKGLTYHDKVKELVQDLKESTYAMTMARGKDLSLAMELALKMKETSHFPVDSYPCSEFYHGPIVTTNDKTQVILFALDKVTNENITKMINDLTSLKAYTLVITNDLEISKLAHKSIYIDESVDRYAMFTAIIILQLYANELSILRGNNPDYHEILEHIETI